MGKNKRLKVHRQWLPGRLLCSIRSNRKWCKRRGSSLECQNCFFVYPIIDSNLKNLTNPKKETIRCVQCKKALYDLGIAKVITPGGNMVRVYNVERTLCDILRPHSRVDIQIVTEAYKQYATSSNRNIPILSEYAKKLKVESKLRAYLEVLL